MKITVKAKVTDDSKNKLGKIESEFQNYQIYLQLGCTAIVNLYSATTNECIWLVVLDLIPPVRHSN